jgi:uncharacterized protein YkwD/uncharacterized membrane protein required for colicin V production
MQVNFVTIFLTLIILLSAWSGFRKGFAGGIFELTGWLGTLLITILLYPPLLSWLEKVLPGQNLLAVGFGFLIVLLGVRMLVAFALGKLYDQLPEHVHETTLNRALGIIPGTISGILYASLLASILPVFPLPEGLRNGLRESGMAKALQQQFERAEASVSGDFRQALNRSAGRLTIQPEKSEFIELNFTVEDPEPLPALEAEMLDLVNGERLKKGLRPLAPDPEMRAVARKHSTDMLQRGYFSHMTPEYLTPFDRMARDKVVFLTAGENLAIAPDLPTAHKGLMESPGHRANILNPAFGRLGIGIQDGGRYGIMVTQNFRN